MLWAGAGVRAVSLRCAIGVFFGCYAAQGAAQLDPIGALRTE